MKFISQAVRRLVLIIPTLLGASGLMFVLTILVPGDPALMRLGNFTTAEQLQWCMPFFPAAALILMTTGWVGDGLSARTAR